MPVGVVAPAQATPPPAVHRDGIEALFRGIELGCDVDSGRKWVSILGKLKVGIS